MFKYVIVFKFLCLRKNKLDTNFNLKGNIRQLRCILTKSCIYELHKTMQVVNKFITGLISAKYVLSKNCLSSKCKFIVIQN